MELSVRNDIKDLTKSLNWIERKVIPTATRNTINDLSFKVSRTLSEELPRHLDRPTKFTVGQSKKGSKTFLVEPAPRDKSNLTSTIHLAPRQRKYLTWQIVGGERAGKDGGVLVPTKNMKLNKFGNMPKTTYSKLKVGGKGLFIGEPKNLKRPGVSGIWKVTGGAGKKKKRRKRGSGPAKEKRKIKLLAYLAPQATYDKGNFPMRRIAEATIQKNFSKMFDESLKINLDKAKRK